MTEVIEQQPKAIAYAFGEDGRQYLVQPVVWNLETLAHYWSLYERHGILSDNIPQTLEGFEEFVLSANAVWFEIMDVTDPKAEQMVGLMYLSDMVQSLVENRFTAATWHATMWDGKAAPRRPILRAGIKAMFRTFGFHRLECQIPLYFAGAIRSAKKLGFVPEGNLREARLIKGSWFNVLVLGLLEQEVAQWET